MKTEKEKMLSNELYNHKDAELTKERNHAYELTLRYNQTKDDETELRTSMLYSDMKEGIVSKEDYVELHAAYGKRLRNAEESIRAIQKEMDSELEKADKANTWLDYFVKYQDIEELSRTVVVELIRQIRVYDKKNIEITFDFDDCYQTLLNQLPAMGVDMVIDDDNNLQVNVKEVV